MMVLLHLSHWRNHSNKTCLIKGMLEAGDDWEGKQRFSNAVCFFGLLAYRQWVSRTRAFSTS
jgi:hypothetical protein